MKKFLILIFLNIIFFFTLLFIIESSLYFSRKLIGKSSVGWIYRTKAMDFLVETPCVRMETHPVLSHTPDHRGNCKILNGHAEGPFVKYSKNFDPAIVVLGGSTTSGFYQHYANGKTWPYLFNQILKREHYNYQVINGAHGGYSSSEELLQLLLNVRKLDNNIKLIISLNGINEYSDNQGNYFLNSLVNEMYERQIWINQSFLSRFFPNIFSFFRYLSPKRELSIIDMKERRNNKLNNFKKMSKVDIWESNVKAMNAVAKSIGAEYVLFLQPTMGLEGKQSIMPKDQYSNDAKILKSLLEGRGVVEGIPVNYLNDLNETYKKFIKKCKTMDFCIDITSTAPPTGNMYSDPRHHNENGNSIIAKEIFDKLNKLNKLK